MTQDLNFSSKEKIIINTYRDLAEHPSFLKTALRYSFWPGASIFFGLLFLRAYEPEFAVAAYVSIFIPYLFGIIPAHRRFVEIGKIFIKFEAGAGKR